ncbi:hypothetical protein C0Z18_22920 [Trinickia dabaoshanensis]|uniref:Uncharacterized protein n=1 Tax=Trinickia dabaoshanensis TaxID=564714 RepID=A0A2N7VHR7_9BURK|nr:hypothetical protein [Trinickia dabaoshanensis]PMS16692.1 hypothetical protein C0Z18_22920 [Trinickia dabaoshanensis]
MRKNKLTAEERRTSIFGLLLFMAAGGLILLCASTAGILQRPETADRCNTNAEGQIIPTRSADGVLQNVGDIYYSHRDGSDDVFIAACFPHRGGPDCHGPVEYVEGHTNEPVHVEFCGKTVTRLTISKNDLRFTPTTQEEFDAINAQGKRFDYIVLGIAVLLIAGSVIGFRRMRRA